MGVAVVYPNYNRASISRPALKGYDITVLPMDRSPPPSLAFYGLQVLFRLPGERTPLPPLPPRKPSSNRDRSLSPIDQAISPITPRRSLHLLERFDNDLLFPPISLTPMAASSSLNFPPLSASSSRVSARSELQGDAGFDLSLPSSAIDHPEHEHEFLEFSFESFLEQCHQPIVPPPRVPSPPQPRPPPRRCFDTPPSGSEPPVWLEYRDRVLSIECGLFYLPAFICISLLISLNAPLSQSRPAHPLPLQGRPPRTSGPPNGEDGVRVDRRSCGEA
jgi:hypothetical protein